jgi:tungstate transport system substrate-binding protein
VTRILLSVFVALLLSAPATGRAEERFIVLQSTTSTQNSGLFDHILPVFEAKTGIGVRVVAVGTGQALKNARNGDGDAVLVHARDAELAFVREGWGVLRCDVMFNDFVLVGPKEDPAGISGLRDAAEALRRIAAARALFVSRGDDSGTHRKELALWREAGFDPAAARGTWYREAGAGMGATLNIAAGIGGYTLADRATWLAFGNRRDLVLLVEGDPRLFNPYGVVVVNPKRHPNVRFAEARAFRDWLVSEEGQAAIASFRIGGEQVFFPDARCDESTGNLPPE